MQQVHGFLIQICPLRGVAPPYSAVVFSWEKREKKPARNTDLRLQSHNYSPCLTCLDGQHMTAATTTKNQLAK